MPECSLYHGWMQDQTVYPAYFGFPSDMIKEFTLILPINFHTLRKDTNLAIKPDEMVMKYPCTGVILAGGLNRRFSGTEKALLEIAGARILDRIFDTFRTLFNEIILITNDPLKYLDWDAHIVTDLFSKRSALTGIHTGLYYATYSHVFVSASDTPFVKKPLIETILGEITPAMEAIVPETAAGLEPLCAVYSKKRLPLVESLLSQNRFKIEMMFKGARMVKIPETRLRESDPELISFININTPQDFEKALTIQDRGRSSYDDDASDRPD